jgi:hypothetical protein
MAEWPSLDELKAQLGITQELPLAREVILQRALAAAIDQVILDTSIEYLDTPTDSVAAAALLLAVRVTKAPDAPFGVAAVFDAGGIYKAVSDPDYRRLLKGHRAAFGVA